MNKTILRNKLCRAFCKYYKPSKKGDPGCMGFQVIERLISKGAPVSFDAPAVEIGRLIQEALVHDMCTFCPFYENDCDFVGGGERFPACGGFILLGRLLETRVISIDIIMDVR